MTTVTSEDKAQLDLLRSEVKQDIALAIANFKIWLLVTVLSNVILIGAPAMYVFFSTTTTAQSALNMAVDNGKRLEARAPFMTSTDARLSAIERHLQERDQFVPPAPQPLPR